MNGIEELLALQTLQAEDENLEGAESASLIE